MIGIVGQVLLGGSSPLVNLSPPMKSSFLLCCPLVNSENVFFGLAFSSVVLLSSYPQLFIISILIEFYCFLWSELP